MIFLLAPILGVIALVCLYVGEYRANNKRIRNGQPPKRYHDLTDHVPPVDVIDWSRRT